MVTAEHTVIHHASTIAIRRIPLLRPLTWVAQGAVDLYRCAPANVGHGIVMTALGWVLLMLLGRHPHYVAAAVSGFLLVAPVMTTGICELSRRRAGEESMGFDASLGVLERHGHDLLRFGLILAVVALLWFALSNVMLATVLEVSGQQLAETYYRGFLDTASAEQVVAYLATGALLALIVFALSVVTVPIIIHRHVNLGTAMATSLRILRANPAAMLLWSAIIVALTAAGFATLLVGMAVLIPILGHATWHAYRDLVE